MGRLAWLPRSPRGIVLRWRVKRKDYRPLEMGGLEEMGLGLAPN
jgi:hypothetical protein